MTQAPKHVAILLGAVILSTAGGFVLARTIESRNTDALVSGFLSLEVPARAVDAFQALHDESPDEPLARAGLALAHLRLGQRLRDQDKFTESAEHIRAAIELQGEVYYFHLELGKTLLDGDRVTEGLAALLEASRLNPRSIGANISSFHILLGTERFKEAERCIERLIATVPENPSLRGVIPGFYRDLAEALELAGDMLGAAAARQRADDFAAE